MPKPPFVSSSSEGLASTVYSVLVERAKKLGKPVHALQVGDTYRDPPAPARAEAQRTAQIEGLHRYSPVQGIAPLLNAVSSRLEARGGRRVSPENIVIVPGATTGLSVVMQTLLDAGDEVLVLAPFWPLIRGIIASRAAVPVEVPFFDRIGTPGFDPERAIESAVTERTTAIYVNSPHNPTGVVLDAATIELIGRVAKKHGLWVITDEAYEELWFTAKAPAPLWSAPVFEGNAIAAHTFSKSYGMAGARVGYVHGPAEAMARIRAVHTFQAYAAPTPMQWAVLAAMEHGDPWLGEAREAYGRAGRRAAERLGLRAPEGGTFLFFDVAQHLKGGESLQSFLERCVDAGVLLTPGSASGKAYETSVRLCFTAVPEAALDDAITRLLGVMHA
jgi:N-succinyldiaminopimelate aminotransferase